MKIVVYSSNIGDYDDFNHPEIIDPNVRYILFTNNKFIKSNVWEICHIDFLDWISSDREKSRYLKTNPHKILPDHDINIWFDHVFTPKIKDFKNFLNDIGFEKISNYKHRFRNCLYDEGGEVIKTKKEYPEIVNNQLNKYKTEGFPINYGLYETGIMIRENTDDMKLFNSIWWSEIKNGSGRDQLSQMYSSWKTGININPITIGNSVYDNSFIAYKKHLKNFKI